MTSGITTRVHKKPTTFLCSEWFDFYPPDITRPSNEITYSGDGAAISIIQSNVHFLVEFSTFVECSTTESSSRGGVLYIIYSDFALNHVCAIKCNSSNSYSFTYVDYSGRAVNSIHQSSIANCFSKHDYTLYHAHGKIDIKSVNLSHNKVNRYSALTCVPSSTKNNDDKIGTNIRYSSFADNIASLSICIYLNYISGSDDAVEHLIRNTNIIRNPSKTTIDKSA